jgi:hypothetical protein
MTEERMDFRFHGRRGVGKMTARTFAMKVVKRAGGSIAGGERSEGGEVDEVVESQGERKNDAEAAGPFSLPFNI